MRVNKSVTMDQQGESPRPGQQIIEVMMPTYAMNPSETEKFFPSDAKKICQRALQAQLDNVVYDEESAKEWILDIGNVIKDGVKSLGIPRKFSWQNINGNTYRRPNPAISNYRF